ncbi:hypothetical protein HPB52_011662 [Rhipicephalus sanguineus]|uniref:Uncharacterized protein n=1 Tax=Rhipicephalus sanguineus TaxID=34632 RepID=A0A9D4T9R5_RHISA|nr:hypothetical protein HPB52_011662 [Rhipicephalus sanguineus]
MDAAAVALLDLHCNNVSPPLLHRRPRRVSATAVVRLSIGRIFRAVLRDAVPAIAVASKDTSARCAAQREPRWRFRTVMQMNFQWDKDYLFFCGKHASSSGPYFDFPYYDDPCSVRLPVLLMYLLLPCYLEMSILWL